MDDPLIHERSYRGEAALQKLAVVQVTLCGAGALGSLLADNLVRQGLRRLTVIDFDRVEAHNAGTQLYRLEEAGGLKVEVLRNALFRTARVEIEPLAKRLDERNARKLLRGAEVVIDTFDNRAGRQAVAEACRESGQPCLHLGLGGGYGEAHWNECYLVPADAVAGNACEAPLARNLILLLVAVGSEALLRWVVGGEMQNYSVTLEDLKINIEST